MGGFKAIRDAALYYEDYVQGSPQNLPLIRGTWFFACPQTGSANNSGYTVDEALDNLKTAYDKCTSGRGDGIVLLSSGTTKAHCTSTLSAVLTWDKFNITVVGICAPVRFSQRARVSNVDSTAGNALATLINVTGDNNRFFNIEFINEGTTGTGCLSVTGLRNYFGNCHFVGGSGVTSASTADMDLSLGGEENVFEKCTFGTDTFDKGNLAGWEVKLTGGGARNRFYNCEFLCFRSAGTTAGMIYGDGGSCITRNVIFDNCHFAVWRLAGVAAEVSVFIGTAPNNGVIIFRNNSDRVGFVDWGAAATARVYSSCPTNHESGGLSIEANPS